MLYNIAGIVLGLCAWGAAAAALAAKKYPPAVSVASFGCALAALLCQLLELARRVRIGDLSAVMDTVTAVCLAAAVLCAGTLLLNAAAAFAAKKSAKK